MQGLTGERGRMKQRERWELQEKEFLAPYGVKSGESKGRKYPEKEHPIRSPFQRDRDRIIHSTAFRRLEYKTQVFIYHEGDYYRNRLTHTIEVQQIARSIARALAVNEDLTEAISLAHDVGHTPFGHKGEWALNEIMQELKMGGFEHNRQGLRVVDKLEKRYPDFPGINLTFETREGIARHKTSYDAPEIKEFQNSKSPSLETQIVNLADIIAYTSHDLDDGLKARLLDEEELSNIEIWNTILKNISCADEDLKRMGIIRALINFLATDLIENTLTNLQKNKTRFRGGCPANGCPGQSQPGS